MNNFKKLYKEIKEINKIESKSTEFKFIKFNEEFGEFNAEYLKLVGLTYKKYNEADLKSEMSDTLQVLLSIYSDIEDKTGITIQDVFDEMIIKNEKWKNKIKEYVR